MKGVRSKPIPAVLIASLMLLILLPMSPVQTVAAETLQDLSIQSAVQPRIDGHYDRWDSIDPLAMIRSEALVQISTRDIEVELCPGNHTLSAECPNDSNLWSRTLILASIMPGSTIEANFGGTQFLAHQSGVHTAVFKFSDQDLDPSDDVLTYLFYIDDPLRDVELSNIDWNETLVRNSGVEYPVPITIDSRNWLTDEPIEVGWSLFKVDAEVGRAGACFYIGLGTANQSDVPVDTVPPRLATIITPGEADNRTIEFSSPDLTSGSSYNLSWTVSLNGTMNETFSGEYEWTNSSVTLAHSLIMDNLTDGEWCVEGVMRDKLLFAGADSNTFLISSNGVSSLLLPNVLAPSEGTYRLQTSILDAPSDPNEWNDVGEAVMMLVDDSVDLWIKEIRPARGSANIIEHQGQMLTLFPFGERSVEVVIGNAGYISVNTTVNIEALDLITQGLVFGPEQCVILIAPGEEISCIFEFPLLGQFNLNATLDSTLALVDENPSDNWFSIDISVNNSAVAPYISSPLEGEVFESGEQINLVAGHSQMAALPLTFEWKLNYEEPIGNGQVANTTLPMGNWVITCFVTDSNNNTEIATRSVKILNRVLFSADPYILSGEAISYQGMTFNFTEPEYPPAGVVHAKAVNLGLSPLRSIGFEFRAIEPGETIEMSHFEVWGNLSSILPDTVPRQSIQIFRVQDSSTGLLSHLDSQTDTFTIFSNDSFHLIVQGLTGGHYMFAGILESTVVNPANLHTEQRSNGVLAVKWDPEGDLENPYLGGWRIYKRELFPFRWPYNSASDFEQTVERYAAADVPAMSTGWTDPIPLEPDTCVSYVVVAFDIQGLADYEHGNVTGWQPLTNPNLQCGDAISPSLTVEGFRSEVTFDSVNDLHTITVSWQWPDYSSFEDNISWNLYRSQNLPTSVRYLDPIATGLWGEVGTTSSFSETESPVIDGIKLGQNYNYILIAIDDVGNTDYLIRDDNTVSVLIEDMFWDNHPELKPGIPEEVRYNEVEWKNQFQKDVRDPFFQQAAIFAIGLIVINMLAIPIIINKNRYAKRKIMAFAKSVATKQSADDFAEEIDDMFD